MFGKIVYIGENSAHLHFTDEDKISSDLINLHVVFEDNEKKILGEIEDISENKIIVHFLGELTDNAYISGVLRKPTMDARIRIVNQQEIALIAGKMTDSSIELGKTPLYNNYPINIDVNDLFSGHLTIFGNSGSGKSCGITRILQNIFHNPKFVARNAHLFLFDVSGEYVNAFKNLNEINKDFNAKVYTTDYDDSTYEKIQIPLALMTVDDIALMLNATSKGQLPIIEKALKLAYLFGTKEVDVSKHKNHIIAKAIMSVYYSNQTPNKIRNEIFDILKECHTEKLGTNVTVHGVGYTRNFKKCFELTTKGTFAEDVLISNYISSFIDESLDDYEPTNPGVITLKELETALNFALISEGYLNNPNTFSDAISLKVRLHSIVISNYGKIFDYRIPTNLEQYLESVSSTNTGQAQMVIFNVEGLDDGMAKTIVKIYSRFIFEMSKKATNRASNPYHILLEEAHRYVQNDSDTDLLGYNIFDRIAKEGRKFGVLLTLISQRVSELSDTTIAQCTNFLLFKLSHPKDVEQVRDMIPSISYEVIEKIKSLQPGTCVAFGKAFSIPWIIRFEMPNPWPASSNADVYVAWQNAVKKVVPQAPQKVVSQVQTNTISNNFISVGLGETMASQTNELVQNQAPAPQQAQAPITSGIAEITDIPVVDEAMLEKERLAKEAEERRIAEEKRKAEEAARIEREKQEALNAAAAQAANNMDESFNGIAEINDLPVMNDGSVPYENSQASQEDTL